MVSEEEIKERIADAQAKIDVPSYQDVAWDGAWKRRAAAIWGMMALAGIVGAAIGLAAPLAPAAFGLTLTAEIIGTSVAVFSAIGISAGLVIGATVGPSVGAAAATMKELERRQIARDVDGILRKDPDAEISIKDITSSQKEEDKEKNLKLSDYFNLKTALVFAAIGTIGGLVFAAAFYAAGGFGGKMAAQLAMPAAELLLGKAALGNAAMVTSYFAGIGALFGANFGVAYPLISRKFVNAAGDLLGGKTLGEAWSKRINKLPPSPVIVPVVDVQNVEAPIFENEKLEIKDKASEFSNDFSKSFERSPDYKTLVEKSIKEDAKSLMA